MDRTIAFADACSLLWIDGELGPARFRPHHEHRIFAASRGSRTQCRECFREERSSNL